MEIGKIIQGLREEANIRQSELAKSLGLGRTTISNYENNYSSPDLETLIQIANFFHVSTDYLLGISSVKNAPQNLQEDEAKVLKYYRRLNSENKDYINGEMIKLFREQESSEKFSKNVISSNVSKM
jgi:transcriptional regulator with XRE-family HTH domain